MGFKCCVPDCKSGYASQKEKVTFFSFPSNPTMRNKWIRLIGLDKNKVIGEKWKVCEKHFIKSYLLMSGEYVDEQGRLRVTTKLREEAVPTVFSLGPLPSKSKRKTSHTPSKPIFDHEYSMGTPPLTPNLKPATVTNSTESATDLTPPETPITKPIRFSFDLPTEVDIPQPVVEGPLNSKDPVYELLHERIKQLEHENHQLSEVTDCFKKVFNPDQIKN